MAGSNCIANLGPDDRDFLAAMTNIYGTGDNGIDPDAVAAELAERKPRPEEYSISIPTGFRFVVRPIRKWTNDLCLCAYCDFKHYITVPRPYLMLDPHLLTCKILSMGPQGWINRMVKLVRAINKAEAGQAGPCVVCGKTYKQASRLGDHMEWECRRAWRIGKYSPRSGNNPAHVY